MNVQPRAVTGKRYVTRVATAALIFGTILSGGFGAAAESVATESLVTELTKWAAKLEQAGGSPAEVAEFRDLVLARSPAELVALEDEIRAALPNFFERYLADARREQAERIPRPLFRNTTPVMSCEGLRGVRIPDTDIDSAVPLVRDGSCRVTATVIHPPGHNAIKVFIALPVHGWNGRFRGTGGGGYAGGDAGNLDLPIAKGYASGATDTGNASGTASFALDEQGKQAWQRLRDNAYIGIHDMTVVGKALTLAFYGKAPRYSYFVGGSTGGRQALTEAQRYPQDYEGIVALYPAIARDRYVPAHLWPQVLMNEAHDFLSKEKRDAATEAAVMACDGLDGVIDGVIDDPMKCHFDPTALIGTRIGDSTFTATDASVIRGIWAGPRTHDGSFLWWGPTRGTDLSSFANTEGSPLEGKPSEEGLDWFRYFLVLDPKWDWTTLTRAEYELLFEQSTEEYASIYGGDDPNLTAFRHRGGKLLVVHGLADQAVPPQKSIDYFESVQKRIGVSQQTTDFFRLFMVPGADHSFDKPVPTPGPAELMGAIIRWVERGQAPATLLADLPGKTGAPIRTRPLFPYPKVSKYKGTGSTDDAANYIISNPTP